MSGSHRFPCPMAAASPTYGPGGRCTCEPIVSTCQHRTIGVASECLDCGETVMRRPHPPAASGSDDDAVEACARHVYESQPWLGHTADRWDDLEERNKRCWKEHVRAVFAWLAVRPAPPIAPSVPEVVAAARRVVAEAKLTDAGWLIDSDAVQDLDDALNSKATKLSAPRRATPEMARAAANAHAASDKDKLDDWIRFVQAALDVANEGQRP